MRRVGKRPMCTALAKLRSGTVALKEMVFRPLGQYGDRMRQVGLGSMFRRIEKMIWNHVFTEAEENRGNLSGGDFRAQRIEGVVVLVVTHGTE